MAYEILKLIVKRLLQNGSICIICSQEQYRSKLVIAPDVKITCIGDNIMSD
jgi:hypothetical protein